MHSSDDEAQRFKDLLAQASSPANRRASADERRSQFTKRDEIARGQQAKAERHFDAKRKAAEREAACAQANKDEAAREQAADEERRVLKRLRTNWGKRLGHYKGMRPAYTGQEEWGRYTPAQMLRRASVFPPTPALVGTAVTDFSGWIFALEHPNAELLGLEIGKLVERRLLSEDRRAIAQRARATVASVALSNPRWKVLHQDDLSSSSAGFPISRLCANGHRLNGRPDLVLQEIATEEVFIVDRKASNFTPPTNGWHNVRAQLWAYSLIDEWASFPSVTLCAEVWSHTPTGKPIDFLVQTWKRGDPILEEGLSELFEAYQAKG